MLRVVTRPSSGFRATITSEPALIFKSFAMGECRDEVCYPSGAKTNNSHQVWHAGIKIEKTRLRDIPGVLLDVAAGVCTYFRRIDFAMSWLGCSTTRQRNCRLIGRCGGGCRRMNALRERQDRRRTLGFHCPLHVC